MSEGRALTNGLCLNLIIIINLHYFINSIIDSASNSFCSLFFLPFRQMTKSQIEFFSMLDRKIAEVSEVIAITELTKLNNSLREQIVLNFLHYLVHLNNRCTPILNFGLSLCHLVHCMCVWLLPLLAIFSYTRSGFCLLSQQLYALSLLTLHCNILADDVWRDRLGQINNILLFKAL